MHENDDHPSAPLQQEEGCSSSSPNGDPAPLAPPPLAPSPREQPPLAAGSRRTPRPGVGALVTVSVPLYAALVGVAVVWGLLDGRSNIFLAPNRSAPPSTLLGAAAGVALGLVLVLLSRLSLRLFGWARGLHRELHPLLVGISTRQALVLAAISALGEEALFRGAALPTLSLVGSALLFGAAHIPLRRRMWPWPLMAFVVGLAFGWLYVLTGDLTGPILAHATINFLNLRHIARTPL